jgi:hypothetical protein
MSEIEKYKTDPKVSGIYKSLEKTINSLESVVGRIEDKVELMDSINENDLNYKLSPEGIKKYDKLFGNKNEDYKLGYEQGYYNGFLDGKNNTTFNNDISWNKYSTKKESIKESLNDKQFTINDLKNAIRMAQETVLQDLRFDDREPKYSEEEIINIILNNDKPKNNISNKLPFDEEIKRNLRDLYSNSVYDKSGKVDMRVNQLFDIHKTWLGKVRDKYSAKQIADKLFIYEKNLNNGK